MIKQKYLNLIEYWNLHESTFWVFCCSEEYEVLIKEIKIKPHEKNEITYFLAFFMVKKLIKYWLNSHFVQDPILDPQR